MAEAPNRFVRGGRPWLYDGPVQAVVFGWAGVLVDHGAAAAAEAMIEAFAGFGVTVTQAQARAPMGLAKRAHIQAIGADADVAAAWLLATGEAFDAAAVGAVFKRFLPIQIAAAQVRVEPIAGAPETLAALRERGVAIGSTTGYPRAVMDALAPRAARRGVAPDVIVCGDDAPEGRPRPFMALRNVIELRVSPVAACVKVDDAAPGVEEGMNAGMWSVGVSMTGAIMACDRAGAEALPAAAREARRAKAVRALADAGAHYVIDSVADLTPVIDDIEARLRSGDRP